MTTAAIEVQGLVKAYGAHTAVDGIDLEVRKGEIFAFLGPNGAGKTTTIEILEGYRARSDGTVRVLGVDPANATRAWRELIGIVLQESEPIPELTAAEAVRMQSHYYTTPRDPEETIHLVGLWDSRNTRTSKLSGGQQRRLDLALALIGDPELVFLDEPTTGFDPSARREAWTMIEALRATGRTVLLTTHYMDEAQQLADRIAVIAGGRIVATGTAQALADQVAARPRITWRQRPDDPPPPGELAVSSEGDLSVIETDRLVDMLNRLTTWALQQQVELTDLAVAQPSLEDTYLALTAGEATGGSDEVRSGPRSHRRRRATS